MNKNYLIDILLFLTEIKAKNEINDKYERELDRSIAFLKDAIDNDNDKKDKDYKFKIRELIIWIVNYFLSP
jgi:hypothetical protein